MSRPKASVSREVPAVPATQKKLIGRGPNMARVTSPYALLVSKSLNVVDLTQLIKCLIIQGIQLLSKVRRIVSYYDVLSLKPA